MSRRRFFCPDLPACDQLVELSDAEANHAARILRLRPGDEVELLDGRGSWATAVLAELDNNRRQPRVTARVISRNTAPALRWQPRLLVAPPRAKLMTQVIRQATELGAARITPIVCAYSVACPDAAEHWRDETIAAVKQSGNRFLPTVDAPCSFADALAGAAPQGIVGDPAAPAVPPTLPNWQPGPLDIWIGPEGGFNADETQALRQRGVRPVRVGPNILRVETAAVAMLAWLWAQIS